MSVKELIKEKMEPIANAIRSVEKSTEEIPVDDMPNKIKNFMNTEYIKYEAPKRHISFSAQAADYAQSYLRAVCGGEVSFSYGDVTVFDGIVSDSNMNGIINNDAFIGLVLRGISFKDSPYYNIDSADKTCEIPGVALASAEWADIDLDYGENGIIREVSDLALYMYGNGRCFSEYDEAEVGDLVFLKSESSKNFKQIETVGIIICNDRNGQLFSNARLLYISPAENDPANVTWNTVQYTDYADKIVFFARPDYTKYFEYPKYDETINRLSYPWCGINKISDTEVSVSTNADNESISINAKKSPTDLKIYLYDEDICSLNLEPGRYRLLGCPGNNSGRLCLENIDDSSDVYEDSGSGLEFLLTDYVSFKAYIHMATKDAIAVGSTHLWEPRLYKINWK